jgi:hypothetical protein
VRWAINWLCFLLSLHVLMWLAEVVRVQLGVRRPGRRPFARAPEVVRRASVDLALQYDTPLRRSRYERLKIAVMTLSGLATLRMTLAFLSFASGALLLNAAARAGRSTRLGPSLREPLVSAALAMARFSLWWLGYFDVQTSGHIAPCADARVLVGNHSAGIIEVLLLYVAARCPSFVTRIENITLPLFAGIAHVSRAIIVDRDLRTSRERTMRDIQERLREPAGGQLMIFPEGTCDNGLALFRFNKGAFVPGLAVQPVLFHYPYAHFNPCFTGEATGGHELPALMWRTACQVCNRAEVKYLPVYHPSEAERQDPLLYASNVQALMASHLHVPVTDATVADYKALAIRHHSAAVDERSGARTQPPAHAALPAQDEFARSRSGSLVHRTLQCASPGGVEAGRSGLLTSPRKSK